VNDKKRIEKFSVVNQEAKECEILDRKEKEAGKKEHIRLIRLKEKKKIREDEHDLLERLQRKSDLRQELKTTANK
jgi:hypothetical protein